MSLAPYHQQSNLLAANCEVADRQALILEHNYAMDYAVAKKEYQLVHQRFSTRQPRAAAPDPSQRVTTQTMCEDLGFYTCCSDPGTTSARDAGDSGTSSRALAAELRERAKVRQQEDVARARKQAEATLLRGAAQLDRGEPTPVERLAQLAAEERADLLEVEAKQFRQLAKTYYDVFFGKYDAVLSTERERRRALEELELGAELETLARLRDKIHLSEELLVMRAMGLFPAQLWRNNRARQLEAVQADKAREEATRVLDCMYAVPLWQRVNAIRAETEAEEETMFHVLQLTHVTEAGLVERHLGRHDMAKDGVFALHTAAVVPQYLDDSVRFVCHAERLFCELREESGRMAIIDAALEGFDEMYSAANQISEDAVPM